MHHATHHYFLPALLLMAAFVGFQAFEVVTHEPVLLKNPYADVNWDEVTAYKANFHAHTVRSDGRVEPDVLIRQYADAGYDIFAVTDHDNHYTHREGERDIMQNYIHRDEYDAVPTSETTWPWTRWIAEEPSKIWVYRGIESSAFYPDLGNTGMLAIRGAELTSHPHISSLFNRCGWPYREVSDEERHSCIEEGDGLSYWVHPTHYVPDGPWEDRLFDDPGWEQIVEYIGRYMVDYDSNLGFEMRLEGDRLERDIEMFDRLLDRFYREHDIFIMGSDDTHATSIADDATLTLVLAEELSEDAVRRALTGGHKFVGSRTDTYPQFHGIYVDEQAKTITLDIDHVEQVTWIRDGEENTTGEVLDYSQMEDAILRFELRSSETTFYSQAFYVK